jgi:hypothetical protein
MRETGRTQELAVVLGMILGVGLGTVAATFAGVNPAQGSAWGAGAGILVGAVVAGPFGVRATTTFARTLATCVGVAAVAGSALAWLWVWTAAVPVPVWSALLAGAATGVAGGLLFAALLWLGVHRDLAPGRSRHAG